MQRMTRKEAWAYLEHPLANEEEATPGRMACIDTATGLLVAGQTSTTLVPIGYFTETLTGDGTTPVRVRFFRERWLHRWDNHDTDPVEASAIGKRCYVVDGSTVAATDGTETRSVAGRVFARTDAYVLTEMADAPTGLAA
jgi:hypothetical protein